MMRWWYSDPIRNARLVLPPRGYLLLFAGFILMVEAIIWYAVGSERPPREIWTPQIVMLHIALALYGGYRVFAFHPTLRPAYREWLRTTSWRVPQTLPLGPVTLTLSDGFWLLLAVALLWWRHPGFVSPLLPILVFATVYFLFVVASLLSDGTRGYGYAVLFGMGCMLMSASNPAIACVWALPTYIAACIGLRQALRRIGSEQFPEILNLVPGPNRSTVERARISPATVGWPFGSLGPIRSRSRLPIADAVVIAALGGWFLACFMTFYGNRSDSARDAEEAYRNVAMIGFAVGAAVLVGRVIHYRIICAPPISFAGRLLTLRWIIPSYDSAFVVPIAGLLLLAGAGYPMLAHPSVIRMSALLTVTLLVGLVPGPAYRNWILTSECRIVPQKPTPPPASER